MEAKVCQQFRVWSDVLQFIFLELQFKITMGFILLGLKQTKTINPLFRESVIGKCLSVLLDKISKGLIITYMVID